MTITMAIRSEPSSLDLLTGTISATAFPGNSHNNNAYMQQTRANRERADSGGRKQSWAERVKRQSRPTRSLDEGQTAETARQYKEDPDWQPSDEE